MLNLIVNSKSLNKKGQKLLTSVKERLSERGVEYHVFLSEKAGDVQKIANAITSAGATRIVVFGGDGTLNEALNGLADPSKCELGLIPTGTGNDFAAAAEIPLGLAALDMILDGESSFVDYIQFDNGKRCMNIAGIGIDVDVLYRYERKGKRRKINYFFSLLSSLIHYRPIELSVQTDDGEIQNFRSLIACVCNGYRFGGGIPICPGAEIDSGKLELLVADCPSRWRIPFELIHLMRGKLLKRPIAHKFTCTSARIFVPEGKTYAQFDGEIEECEGLSARIESGKLKMFRG